MCSSVQIHAGFQCLASSVQTVLYARTVVYWPCTDNCFWEMGLNRKYTFVLIIRPYIHHKNQLYSSIYPNHHFCLLWAPCPNSNCEFNQGEARSLRWVPLGPVVHSAAYWDSDDEHLVGTLNFRWHSLTFWVWPNHNKLWQISYHGSHQPWELWCSARAPDSIRENIALRQSLTNPFSKILTILVNQQVRPLKPR